MVVLAYQFLLQMFHFATNQNNEVPLGQQGELCVKGPQVMRGYWNNPDETQKVFSPRWLAANR